MLHPQVDTFLMVVESGSFSRAALQKNCSTVSVMNQINNFEGRLDIKLLERSSQGVSLTEAGRIFYEEVKKLKILSDNILKNSIEASSGQLPVINIGNSFLRPCKPLLDKLQNWGQEWANSYQIRIVPFNDEAKDFSRLRNRLGEEIDCFIGPYDNANWINNFSIYHLGYYKCCVSIPAGHPLACKKELTWLDMGGENLMLVARGLSPVIDQIRYEIEKHHSDITIIDSPSYYDIETFNLCQQRGYLMETPESWSGIYPGIVTIPVDWPYMLPFGMIYSKRPSPALESFIRILEGCPAKGSNDKDQNITI